MAEADHINFPKIMRDMNLMYASFWKICIQLLSFKNISLRSNPAKVFSSNTYKVLGSVCPCILDALDTLKSHIKTDSYANEGGYMITPHGYYALKDMSARGLARGRSASCARNEQKSVGIKVGKKRKPRSANLGSVGLGRPF